MRNIMKRLVLLLVVFLSVHLGATTYYVAKTGSDGNPGTEGLPLLTIQAGVNKAYAGDLVMVLAGTYNEQVTFARSGTDGSPITVRGEVDGGGDPLAIMDNTAPVGATWTAAPGRGAGIYKKAGFTPDLMLWNGGQIIRIPNSAMEEDSGFNVLNYAADKEAGFAYPPYYTIDWWDDVMCIYGVLDDTCFIRFRDGDDPDTCDLRALEGATTTAMLIDGVDYITVEHLKIQGCQTGIYLNGANHCIVQHCTIRNGNERISIWNGADSNDIRHNDLSLGYGSYGNFGEWNSNNNMVLPEVSAAHAAHLYDVCKFLQGESSTFTSDMNIKNAGVMNKVDSNDFHDGGIGITMWKDSRVHIFGNSFTNFSSIAVLFQTQTESIYVYDNTVLHANLFVRFGDIASTDDTLRSGYIYNNRFYNDPGTGSCFKFHDGGANDTMRAPSFWVYHNSLVGGDDMGSTAPPLCRRMHFVNNIFNCASMDAANNAANDTNPNAFMDFDYNFCGGAYRSRDGKPMAWLFRDRNNQWSTDTMAGDTAHHVWPYYSEPDWVVPETSQAYRSGLSLSDSFTIRGTTYGPLPGMTPGYFTGDKPNLGAVQSPSRVGMPQGDSGHGSVTRPLELTFAPNPATGRYAMARCAIPKAKVGKLTLRDVLGRTVKSIPQVRSGITQIDLRGVTPGIYIAALDAGGPPVSRKLIITAH